MHGGGGWGGEGGSALHGCGIKEENEGVRLFPAREEESAPCRTAGSVMPAHAGAALMCDQLFHRMEMQISSSC